MKKILLWILIPALIGWLLAGDFISARAIARLNQEVQILNENNLQLIRVNEALSKGVSDVAAGLIEKAEWDAKVAAKIRELDALVKGQNVRTNQGISETIH